MIVIKPLEVSIGEVKNNCTVIAIDKSGKDAKLILKCNECGKQIRVYRYKFVAGKFYCSHGRRIVNPEKYVGMTIGKFKLIKYKGKQVVSLKENMPRPLFDAQCIECGKIYYDLVLSRLQSFQYNCDCEKKDHEKLFYKKYSHLIGTVKGTDTIIGIEYRGDLEANHRSMARLRCNDCQAERLVSIFAIVNEKGVSYKQCNCKPYTYEKKDPGKKYKQIYLNKRFGKLVVTDLIVGTTIQNTIAICQCDCGNIFQTILSNIAAGDTHSCGCMRSYGEHIVCQELRRLNIHFSYQQKMNDLFSSKGRRLIFDFMLFNEKNVGIAVIEVDGIQHREPTIFGSKLYHDEAEALERFNAAVDNDRRKEKYVKSHGGLFYRIKLGRDTSESFIIDEVGKIINDLANNHKHNIFLNQEEQENG